MPGVLLFYKTCNDFPANYFPFEILGNDLQFDDEVALTVSRIMLEAFNNAIMNADASEIALRSMQYRDRPRLILTDDGRGIIGSVDMCCIPAKPGGSSIAYTNVCSSGIGLQGMQSGTHDFLWYDIGNNIHATQNNDGGVSGTQKRVHPPGISSSEGTVNFTNTGSIQILFPTPPTYTSTPCPPSGGFPGDGNNDGFVDVKDFVLWLYHFGQSVTGANNGILIMTVINDDYINWVGNC